MPKYDIEHRDALLRQLADELALVTDHTAVGSLMVTFLEGDRAVAVVKLTTAIEYIANDISCSDDGDDWSAADTVRVHRERIL